MTQTQPVDASGNPLTLGGAEPSAPDPAAGSMPTFTGGTAGKTFGGIPTNQFQPNITIPGYHPPGPYNDVGDQSGPSTQPIYAEGDQWAPLSDPDKDNVRALQVQLVNAGLLKTSQVHLGVWDTRSADAYAKVLAYANTQGEPASKALKEYGGQLPAKAINPEDLKGMAQQAAENFLGRTFSDTELSQFETAFQSALSSQGAPQTSTGMDQLAQDVITKEHPKEAASTNLHLVSQHAVQILTSPQYSTPTAPR